MSVLYGMRTLAPVCGCYYSAGSLRVKHFLGVCSALLRGAFQRLTEHQ